MIFINAMDNIICLTIEEVHICIRLKINKQLKQAGIPTLGEYGECLMEKECEIAIFGILVVIGDGRKN